MGLLALRRAVTIIPQDPTLFKGSCAHNLDPFGMHTKEALLAALRSTQLPESILDSEVEKGGSNLSSGERQLLCFARALLQKRPILILDEATSNLDAASDERIQRVLRREFDGTTLLTIAHRLATVIDYDIILVLSRGQLLEQGPPGELLSKPDGALAAMVHAAGGREAVVAAGQAHRDGP